MKNKSNATEFDNLQQEDFPNQNELFNTFPSIKFEDSLVNGVPAYIALLQLTILVNVKAPVAYVNVTIQYSFIDDSYMPQLSLHIHLVI